MLPEDFETELTQLVAFHDSILDNPTLSVELKMISALEKAKLLSRLESFIRRRVKRKQPPDSEQVVRGPVSGPTPHPFPIPEIITRSFVEGLTSQVQQAYALGIIRISQYGKYAWTPSGGKRKKADSLEKLGATLTSVDRLELEQLIAQYIALLPEDT